MAGPRTAPLAPSKPNELRVPATRLPLGGGAESRSSDTFFEVWIPTRYGGQLTVQHWEGGSVQIVDRDKPLTTADRAVTARIAPGKARTVLVKATGGPSARVSCKFSQTALARQGQDENKDKVLVPYNFWYWPTVRAKSLYADKALDVLSRYAKATRGVAAVKDATDWEHDEHGRDQGPAWQGHCHHAAPASAIFELPADTKINGESFTLDEMKYLATEFFGNFGNFKVLDGPGRAPDGPFHPGRGDLGGPLALPEAGRPSHGRDAPPGFRVLSARRRRRRGAGVRGYHPETSFQR
jgi:hypothetical protein